MANNTPGQEISSLDFESILGGPLVAVVNAQAQAAMSTVNFIKSVGFKPPDTSTPDKPATGEPIYVTFKYPKEIAPYKPKTEAIGDSAHLNGIKDKDGNIPPGAKPNADANIAAYPDGLPSYSAEVPESGAVIQMMKFEVPILTILPIPFIRIEETTIDFNVKINSMQYKATDSSLKVDAAISGEAKYPPLFSAVSAKMKVSTSYQKNTREGEKINRTYSMAVHIRAVQDEMPAGMEKMLGILEDAMRSQPDSAPAPTYQ